MAYHLQATEIEKVRAVATRAVKFQATEGKIKRLEGLVEFRIEI